MAKKAPPLDHQTTEPRSQNVVFNRCQAETVVGLPADSCPWVGKLRTVLPLSDVIRDSAVQLVLTHQHANGGVCGRDRSAGYSAWDAKGAPKGGRGGEGFPQGYPGPGGEGGPPAPPAHGWTTHSAPDGHCYYYNARTGTRYAPPLVSPCAVAAPLPSCVKVANRTSRDFGWESSSRDARPTPSYNTSVSRTEGYMYAAKVRALSVVQGPFSVAPCQALIIRFATFTSLYALSPTRHAAILIPLTVC
jgi:hypothetical protein